MTPEEEARWIAAEELAIARGCVVENDCWMECVEAALDEIEHP